MRYLVRLCISSPRKPKCFLNIRVKYRCLNHAFFLSSDSFTLYNNYSPTLSSALIHNFHMVSSIAFRRPIMRLLSKQSSTWKIHNLSILEKEKRTIITSYKPNLLKIEQSVCNIALQLKLACKYIHLGITVEISRSRNVIRIEVPCIICSSIVFGKTNYYT